MEALRIALVASSYAPYIGGVEQHTAQVAGRLRDRGHHVEVWTVARDGVPAVRAVDSVTVRDLPTPLPARRLSRGLRFAWSFPRAWLRWVRAWRRFRPQVLHIQCFGPNGLYATALSSMTRTPLVLSSHGETDADDSDIFRTSSLVPAGLRRAVVRASAVTGCSESVARDLHEHFGADNVVVVPNGVSDLELGAVQKVPGRVVGVGRLEYNKGFDLLIRAVAEVEDSELVLVGDGARRPELEALAGNLGVADRVSFVGVRSAIETRRAIAGATVVAVPSRKESFGLVALEAWSGGTPLVATSTCGPATFVTDEVDGLLVDPSDTVAFADALRRVVRDEALVSRLAAAGRSAVRKYTWGAVAERYEAIYAQVVSAD